MKKLLLCFAAWSGLLCVGIATSSPAFASVVNVSGDLMVVAQPDNLVYSGVLVQSGTPSLAGRGPVIFSEFSGRVVPDFTRLNPLYLGFSLIDLTTPGTYPSDPTTEMRVLSGETIDSFIIHFDPSEYSGSIVHIASGSVTFDRPFFGVQTSGFFDERETYLDLPNIQLYGSSGLELLNDPEIGDQLVLSSDLKTLSFQFRSAGATEDLRIYFNSVPEPGSLSLLGFGLAGLAVSRRKRKSIPA